MQCTKTCKVTLRVARCRQSDPEWTLLSAAWRAASYELSFLIRAHPRPGKTQPQPFNIRGRRVCRCTSYKHPSYWTGREFQRQPQPELAGRLPEVKCTFLWTRSVFLHRHNRSPRYYTLVCCRAILRAYASKCSKHSRQSCHAVYYIYASLGQAKAKAQKLAENFRKHDHEFCISQSVIPA